MSLACTNWLVPNLGARNDLVSISPDPYFMRRGGRHQTTGLSNGTCPLLLLAPSNVTTVYFSVTQLQQTDFFVYPDRLGGETVLLNCSEWHVKLLNKSKKVRPRQLAAIDTLKVSLNS